LRSPYERQPPPIARRGLRRWMARGSGWRCRIKDPQQHTTGRQLAGMLCRSLKMRRGISSPKRAGTLRSRRVRRALAGSGGSRKPGGRYRSARKTSSITHRRTGCISQWKGTLPPVHCRPLSFCRTSPRPRSPPAGPARVVRIVGSLHRRVTPSLHRYPRWPRFFRPTMPIEASIV
jgi:hypothetical protein